MVKDFRKAGFCQYSGLRKFIIMFAIIENDHVYPSPGSAS